jgi:biopolymer transport protein ExbD
MKLNIIYRVAPVYLLMLVSVGCFKGRQTQSQTGVNVALPRNTKNAEVDPSLNNDSAVILSVPNDEDFYVGKEKFPLDQIDYQIVKVRKGSSASALVYLAAGDAVKYDTIIRVLQQIRKQGIREIACLAEPDDPGSAPKVFKVKIPGEPNPKDLSTLKPNPLALVVSFASDLNLKLNQERVGTVNDPQPLNQWLVKIFQQRQEQYAYNPDRATSHGLTEDQRVEKTIVIKADKSVRYGDVISVIDAVSGARANPIVLQIDDNMAFQSGMK